MKNLPSILFGLFLGVALVLACSDAPHPSDAAPDTPAVCDCPAAEPPIAARVVVVKNDVVIPATGTNGSTAACVTPGSILLSGSCDLPANDQKVTISRAGFSMASNNEWTCEWTNNNVAPVNAQVLAKCLVP